MVLLEAFFATLGTTWRLQLKKLGLASASGVTFGAHGYELLVVQLLQKVERNAGWESVEDYDRTIQALQRNVIRPLKVEKFADKLKTGILLRGVADKGEHMIRAIATEFNGNIVRVNAFELLNCFYVKSLFRIIKKLRPVIVVVDNADIVLQEASGYPKAQELKMKLVRRWPAVEDQICLIATTNLNHGLDRGFIKNTFKVSIDVSKNVRSPSLTTLFSSPDSDQQVTSFISSEAPGPSNWKPLQESSIVDNATSNYNHLKYPKI
ncbi:hypothetical protein M3Y95_00839300 [Aphelenchoides besseyi]|nr:hypothetical protein M3Y95_00839300 [Aphelenchoides besseyi]